MDLTDTIVPRSDQLNAEDLLAGPQTVTIVNVRKGSSGEQPVDVVLAEYGPGRPFKPSKTVRRVLVACWGPDATAYVGRRMTLYRDPDVRFGGEAVGGIRVSHLSHLDRARTLALTVTRGKRAAHRVEPLPVESPAQTLQRLRAEWQTADPDRRKVIEAAVAALQDPEPDLQRGDPSAQPSAVAAAEQAAAVVEDPPDEEHDPTLDPEWPGEPLDGAR